MPLVKCPACGKSVSPNAPACLGCGEPIKSSVEKASGAINLKDPVHVIGLILVGIFILVIIVGVVAEVARR